MIAVGSARRVFHINVERKTDRMHSSMTNTDFSDSTSQKKYVGFLNVEFVLFAFMLVIVIGGHAILADEKRPSPLPQPASHTVPYLFDAGLPIPVAKSRRLTQIGRAPDGRSFRPIIMGTADLFGRGPYDLFVHPDRLFPFQEFDDQGVPIYGAPIRIKGHPMNGVVMTGRDNDIYGVFAGGKKFRVCKLNRTTLEFESHAISQEIDLPTDIGIGLTARIDESGKLDLYYTIADGLPYRPPPPSEYQPKSYFPYYHDATYMPYDGAGFWRGNIHRRMLYHSRFDSLKLEQAELTQRVSQGPGEFLFDAWGMTVANLGRQRPLMLISSEHLGMLRYFSIDPVNGHPSQKGFINNANHVGMRHPVINSSVKAIQDPVMGWSNLIVGDSGRVWFYGSTGTFSPNGSPIYKNARPVMAEGVPLSLGELPIISSGDVDRDGLVDLIAGNDAGHLLFLKNVGTRNQPQFDNPVSVMVGTRPLDLKAGYRGSIQGPAEAIWGYTCPTLYDWNGDGQLDVVLNSILGDYMILLQESPEGLPKFSEPKLLSCDGLQLHLAWRCQPAVTDWRKSGQTCLIALDEQNLLRCFWRIDNENVERGELLRLQDGSSITANVDESAGQTGRAKLVAHDWDGDGAIDLLIGTSRGLSFPASKTTYYPSHFYPEHQASVLFLRNVGSNEKPVFDYARLLEFEGTRIRLGIHCCSPAPVDLGRGVIDLLVGEENGTIRYFPREKLTVSVAAQ